MKHPRSWLLSWMAFVSAIAVGSACIDATTVYTVPDMPRGGDDGGGGAPEAGGDGGASSDALSSDGAAAVGDGGGASNDAADALAGD